MTYSLNQLNKTGKITFNLNTPNQKILKISNNIIVFITKLIISFAENYLQDIEGNQNKTIGFMKLLFLDNNEENIESKKELCQGIMNSFLYYYPSIDFENTDFNEVTFMAYSSKELKHI